MNHPTRLTEDKLSLEDAVRLQQLGNEDFYKIQKSHLGGLGAFAVRDLERGQVILTEKPLLRTTHSMFPRDFFKLPVEDQKIFMTLGQHEAEWSGLTREEKIKDTNSFLTLPGIAIFLIASRFNHACGEKRNVNYAYDEKAMTMVFRVHRPITAGTELLISYGGSPEHLYSMYGFCCTCGGCAGYSREDIKKHDDAQWN